MSFMTPQMIAAIQTGWATLATETWMLKRNGTTVGTFMAYGKAFDARAVMDIGVNPGIQFQVWHELVSPTASIGARQGDDVTNGTDSYFVGIVDTTNPALTHIIGWKFTNNVAFNVLDQSGGVQLSNWPGIIDESAAPPAATGTTVLQASADATLYCAANDQIRPGRRIVVTQVNGVTAAGPQAVNYTIKSRNDRYSYGRFLVCELSRR